MTTVLQKNINAYNPLFGNPNVAFSVSDKVLLLRLISDICPNSPELKVCSKFKEDDYVIMKPHDVIVNYAIDERSVGIAVISGEGGSGKTYGIGYYLFYRHFSRGYNVNNTVIYSILTKEYNDLKLEVKRSKVALPERIVHDMREFFRFLTGLKGEYNMPMFVHLVIDNVNDIEDLLKIVMIYRETVRLIGNKPVLKVYLLTRIKTKKIAENLRRVGLDGPHPIWSTTTYMKENASICKFFNDGASKYKVIVCKMRYDAYSYSSFISDLLDKVNGGLNFSSALLNRILTHLKAVAHIRPSLVVERIRNLVLNIKQLTPNEFENEIIDLLFDYPYTLALYYAYIPRSIIASNHDILSRRLTELFLRKYLKLDSSAAASIAISRSSKIPLTFMMLGDKVYSLAFVQSRKGIYYALEKTDQLISDLKKDRYGSKRIATNVVLLYPWRLKWMSKEIKNVANQVKNYKIEGKPLSRKDILYLVNGLFHRS